MVLCYVQIVRINACNMRIKRDEDHMMQPIELDQDLKLASNTSTNHQFILLSLYTVQQYQRTGTPIIKP